MLAMNTMVEPASLEWFIDYMRLPDSGVVPSVTPSPLLPSRRSMARFWGPKAAKGWTFHNHGCMIYEYYARSLFNRVLQIPWPILGVPPFHFARGLMAEALGVEVSWAKLAYKMCHPYQSRTGIPQIMEDFRTLTAPLPELGIVIPKFDREVWARFLRVDRQTLWNCYIVCSRLFYISQSHCSSFVGSES